MSQTAQLALQVLKALSSHTFDGRTRDELAMDLGASAQDVQASLDVLVGEGFALCDAAERYALSADFLQMAQAYADATGGNRAIH